jgi:hypothetical protein
VAIGTEEGSVRTDNLTFAGLVVLPVAVAICLGLSMRELVGGGRTWPFWMLLAVGLGAVWLHLLPGAL